MAEKRLERTRQSYVDTPLDPRSPVERWLATIPSIASRYRLMTDPDGPTRQERLPDRFIVRD